MAYIIDFLFANQTLTGMIKTNNRIIQGYSGDTDEIDTR
jgi:hypothetical protein